MTVSLSLPSIRTVIFDADGTLWRGSEPLPGLAAVFAFLQRHGVASAIVTNSTVQTPARYRQKLAAFGVTSGPDEVLTASEITAVYVANRFGAAAVFVIGEEGLRQALVDVGCRLVPDARHAADAVVVGGGRTLTYAKLKDAVLHIRAGAAFIGANPDILVPIEEGLVPEAGTLLAALQAASGVAALVLGKPERPFFDLALARLNADPATTLMVGDRLETDILGGRQAGLRTVLVLTGVDTEATIPIKGIVPDGVFGNLTDMLAAWQMQLDRQDRNHLPLRDLSPILGR